MTIRFLCVLFQTLDRERVNRCKAFFAMINTLTASAILGQTRLPLLNPKPQIPTFKKQSAFAA